MRSRTRSRTELLALYVLTYHYVRDFSRAGYPRLKGMPVADFERQLDDLSSRFEMASIESALEFLNGTYVPKRHLCLVTFDDGLKEHYEEVLPRLLSRRIEGTFFPITSCLEGRVAAVHKNHFLMAVLHPTSYRRQMLDRLAGNVPVLVDRARARATYRWDDEPTAELKYLLNFVASRPMREAVLDDMFLVTFGDERAFAKQLYLDWSQVTALQRWGMVIGGHTHTHPVLAQLDAADQAEELKTSRALLERKLLPQSTWPFSYPFGKHDAFDRTTVAALENLTYSCAFTTVPGANRTGHDRFRIGRLDPKDV